MADKAYLRNEMTGLTEFLPRKYLRLFPHLREVRTGKPVAPELRRQPETEVSSYYDQFKVTELQSMIDERNADRDPEGEFYVKPASTRKADLMAALDADDIHLAQKEGN